MTTERKFPIAYRVDVEPHTKEELRAKGLGGTDAIVLVSIIRDELAEPHKGPKSIAILTKDGRDGGEIPDTELFQVWAHLAHQLKDCPRLRPWQRAIASKTFERVRTFLLAGR